MKTDTINIKGRCKVEQIARDKDGDQVELPDDVQKKYEKDNLIVNVGRSKIAKLIGGEVQGDFVDRIQLGDLGGNSKASNYPVLKDTGLVNEIKDKNGNPGGTYQVKDQHKLYPAQTDRIPSSGTWASTEGAVSISGGESIFEDTSAQFKNDGVQRTDQLVLDTNTTHPLALGVKEVRSHDKLVVHNPREYETPANDTVQYRVENPGTQFVVSREIPGNDFSVSEWGPAVLVHEAGLIFNDDTFLNRVLFYPQDNDKGLLLQNDSINGIEISARFEWVLTL